MYNFPDSPTNGQEYVAGSVTFVWNGYGWTVKGGGALPTDSYVLKSGDTMTGGLTVAGGITGVPAVEGIRLGFAGGYSQVKLAGATGSIIDFGITGDDYKTRLMHVVSSNTFQIATAKIQVVNGLLSVGIDPNTLTSPRSTPIISYYNVVAREHFALNAYVDTTPAWRYLSDGTAVVMYPSGTSFFLDGIVSGTANALTGTNSYRLKLDKASGSTLNTSLAVEGVTTTGVNTLKYAATGSGSGFWHEVPGVGNRFYSGTDGATDVYRVYTTGYGNAFTINSSGDMSIPKLSAPWYLALSGGSMTGMLSTAYGSGITTGGPSGSLEVRASTPTTPSITFHRTGAFAMNFGMDNNGNLAFGGWSHGGNQWQVWSSRDGTPLWNSGGTVYGTLTVTGAVDMQSTTTTRGNHWVWGGVLYMSQGGHYFQWDGSNYHMPHGNLYILGTMAVRAGTDANLNSLTTAGTIVAQGNVYSNSNHYFLAGGGAWIRWRGDLTKIDTSHAWVIPNIEVGSINCRTSANNYHFNWDGTLKAFIDGGDWGSVLNVHSDYRLKKDVVDLPSMWGQVKALRPVKYTAADWAPYSKSDNIERWGFIAHELQDTLLPTASTGHKDSEGAPQQPYWTAVVAALCKALQEAMARIETLEATHV